MLATTLWAAAAAAAAQGSHEVSLGLLHARPDTRSTTLAVVSPVPGEIAGSGFSVDALTTLGLSYAYRFDDRLSLEIAGAWPRRAHFPGTGTLGPIGELGSARVIAPVALLRWRFGKPSDALRFNVAAGVNYTRLPDARLSDTFSQALSLRVSGGTTAALPSSASFSSSWNWAAGVGAGYRVAPDWRIDANLTYLPLESTATIRTQAGPVEVVSEGTLKIRPLILYLAATKEF